MYAKVTSLTICSGDSSTSAEIVDHGGVALYSPVYRQVAPIAGIRNLSVFEHAETAFNSICRFTTILQYSHADLGCIGHGREVVCFVCKAMKACASMYEDSTQVAALVLLPTKGHIDGRVPERKLSKAETPDTADEAETEGRTSGKQDKSRRRGLEGQSTRPMVSHVGLAGERTG